ncbi:MAG: HAMP domain-containing histidine kinase [Prevotella sp.]|nr:HAMP domain-containing histidine kinase [Prevotella sp.]MBP9981726.1 HAMP domain-containing histidine kinase [Prevotella sp.]
MEVLAEAMRSLSIADENTDLNLVLKVINENNTIPVIVVDKSGKAQIFRNVDLKGYNYADSLKDASRRASIMKGSGRFVRIAIDNRSHDYIDVCYDDSIILKRLAYYPYVQLGVVLIFVAIAIFALLAYKKAEQNMVWVGLSKETAHQLGTPISSLLAWIEIFKDDYPKDSLVPEMEKDVKHLQIIADRFSKIGSLPSLCPVNLVDVINHVVDYMEKRNPSSISVIRELPDHDVIIMLNASLFEWVVENLFKNAVDSMSGMKGTISVKMSEIADIVSIEISDTGKGIRPKDINNVFRPGFTTKKRGWGLGLSLAKRIVEDYHKGKIFVKYSDVGKGTVFCIELPNPPKLIRLTAMD